MAVAHTDRLPSTDLIRIYDGNLTEEFCELCIERFEDDDRKHQGITGRGIRPDIKDSTDLLISRLPEWAEMDAVFREALEEPVQDYFELLNEYTELIVDLRDSGYQIQRTSPSGGYIWHNDAFVYEDRFRRLFTYIWYLNTVEEGGETEFLDQKIQPVAGRLLLFPATWTYLHRGLAPRTGLKYICTGWMQSGPAPLVDLSLT